MPKKGKANNSSAWDSIFDMVFSPKKSQKPKTRPQKPSGKKGYSSLISEGLMELASNPSVYSMDQGVKSIADALTGDKIKLQVGTSKPGEFAVKFTDIGKFASDPDSFVEKVMKSFDDRKAANKWGSLSRFGQAVDSALAFYVGYRAFKNLPGAGSRLFSAAALSNTAQMQVSGAMENEIDGFISEIGAYNYLRNQGVTTNPNDPRYKNTVELMRRASSYAGSRHKALIENFTLSARRSTATGITFDDQWREYEGTFLQGLRDAARKKGVRLSSAEENSMLSTLRDVYNPNNVTSPVKALRSRFAIIDKLGRITPGFYRQLQAERLEVLIAMASTEKEREELSRALNMITLFQKTKGPLEDASFFDFAAEKRKVENHLTLMRSMGVTDRKILDKYSKALAEIDKAERGALSSYSVDPNSDRGYSMNDRTKYISKALMKGFDSEIDYYEEYIKRNRPIMTTDELRDMQKQIKILRESKADMRLIGISNLRVRLSNISGIFSSLRSNLMEGNLTKMFYESDFFEKDALGSRIASKVEYYMGADAFGNIQRGGRKREVYAGFYGAGAGWKNFAVDLYYFANPVSLFKTLLTNGEGFEYLAFRNSDRLMRSLIKAGRSDPALATQILGTFFIGKDSSGSNIYSKSIDELLKASERGGLLEQLNYSNLEAIRNRFAASSTQYKLLDSYITKYRFGAIALQKIANPLLVITNRFPFLKKFFGDTGKFAEIPKYWIGLAFKGPAEKYVKSSIGKFFNMFGSKNGLWRQQVALFTSGGISLEGLVVIGAKMLVETFMASVLGPISGFVSGIISDYVVSKMTPVIKFFTKMFTYALWLMFIGMPLLCCAIISSPALLLAPLTQDSVISIGINKIKESDPEGFSNATGQYYNNLPGSCPFVSTLICTQGPEGVAHNDSTIKFSHYTSSFQPIDVVPLGDTTFYAPVDGVVSDVKATNLCPVRPGCKKDDDGNCIKDENGKPVPSCKSYIDMGGSLIFKGDNGYQVRLLHIKPLVSSGQRVVKGQALSTMQYGIREGCCWTGPHYHIQLQDKTNTLNWYKANCSNVFNGKCQTK